MMFIARDSISADDYKISQDGQRRGLNSAGVKGLDENGANRVECANHHIVRRKESISGRSAGKATFPLLLPGAQVCVPKCRYNDCAWCDIQSTRVPCSIRCRPNREAHLQLKQAQLASTLHRPSARLAGAKSGSLPTEPTAQTLLGSNATIPQKSLFT